jgi:hypothetical protein
MFYLLVLMALFNISSNGTTNPNMLLIKQELYNLDQHKQNLPAYRVGRQDYIHPQIVSEWFKITDNYLLSIFNDASKIAVHDEKILFNYSRDATITLDMDLPPCEDKLPFYKTYIVIGNPELDDEISEFYFKIKPFLFNDRQYYFVEMNRIFIQRGGVQYGAVRIIGKSPDQKYLILVKHEEVLPHIKEIDEVLTMNGRGHDVQNMAWIPFLCFSEMSIKGNAYNFTLWYGFNIYSTVGTTNGVKIDWSFDGKKMKPRKVTLLPWEEPNYKTGEFSKHDKQEYIINND